MTRPFPVTRAGYQDITFGRANGEQRRSNLRACSYVFVYMLYFVYIERYTLFTRKEKFLPQFVHALRDGYILYGDCDCDT